MQNQQIYILSPDDPGVTDLTLNFFKPQLQLSVRLNGLQTLAHQITPEELPQFQEDLQAVVDKWLEQKGIRREP